MSDGIDLSKSRPVRPAMTSTTSLLVHAKLFGSVGCRHRPVQSGYVSEGGLDGLQRVMRFPPPCHTPILGVYKNIIKVSVGSYPATCCVPQLTPMRRGLEAFGGLHPSSGG